MSLSHQKQFFKRTNQYNDNKRTLMNVSRKFGLERPCWCHFSLSVCVSGKRFPDVNRPHVTEGISLSAQSCPDLSGNR